MPLFYWAYSNKTLLLKPRLGKKAEPLIVLGKTIKQHK